jgi:hypothetical protein
VQILGIAPSVIELAATLSVETLDLVERAASI